MALNDEARQRFDKIDDGIEKLFDLNRDTQRQPTTQTHPTHVRYSQTASSVNGAHEKINGHLEEHRDRAKEKRATHVALWGGLVLALAGALFAVVKISFR